MRQVFAIAVLTAFVAAGCASKNKAAETHAPAPAAAPAKAEPKSGAPAAAAKEAATKAAAAVADAGAKVECANKADKRTLEVRAKDKGCELAYTKGGQEAVVASAKNGKSHCENSLNKIKEKLTAAGYTCN